MARARSWRTAWWAFIWGSCLGCQVLLDVDAQCQQTSDCEAMFGAGTVCGAGGVCSGTATTESSARAALPERWACVGQPVAPLERDPSRTVTLALSIYDYVDGRPLSGVTARACAHADVPCARPVGEDRESNSVGRVEFELPHGFDGHFELTARGMMPLIMSDGPLADDGTVNVPMLSSAAVSQTAMQGGERYDEGLGCVLLEVLDCNGEAADGVQLEAVAAPDNRPFYFADAAVTRELDATMISNMGQPPEPTALAGFLNVEPGFATFRASLEPGGQHLTYVTLQVRPQSLTLTRFRAGGP